jgi:hypothetical protein
MADLQYITDYQGNRVSAVVPFMLRNSINERCRLLQNKLDVLLGIQEGVNEVNSARSKGKKLQTLSAFLDECNG